MHRLRTPKKLHWYYERLVPGVPLKDVGCPLNQQAGRTAGAEFKGLKYQERESVIELWPTRNPRDRSRDKKREYRGGGRGVDKSNEKKDSTFYPPPPNFTAVSPLALVFFLPHDLLVGPWGRELGEGVGLRGVSRGSSRTVLYCTYISDCAAIYYYGIYVARQEIRLWSQFSPGVWLFCSLTAWNDKIYTTLTGLRSCPNMACMGSKDMQYGL